MANPNHTRTPKRKPQRQITPKRDLPIGLRSAKQIRDGRKQAVIVPVSERPWVATVAVGEQIRMPIAVKGRGVIGARVTGTCTHETLASIPECPSGHDVERIDAEGDWHTVLLKAAWGSNRAQPTAVMDKRARSGWVVLSLKTTWLPREWQARARRRLQEAQAQA